ncbi:MAG: hypothetical protein J7M14_06455, partial [Planctomycetes bacterium]|nr:hypothetical protein [Planctomycetota bacterium]
YMEEIRVGDGTWPQYQGFEEWNILHPAYAFDTSARYYDADYPTEPDVVAAWENAINNNEMSIISHLAHGFWTDTLNLGMGSDLSNSYFFLGTSQACLSGRFTQGFSGPEGFIINTSTHGAYALVLNTGYGYGSMNSTHGASQQQHKIFWDYFFTNQSTDFSGWRLGDAMRYTKDTFSSVIDSSSHAYCYVWYSWNLFGDPAQTLRINGESNTAPAIVNPTPSDNSVDVSVNTSILSVFISDADGDTISWSIETSPDIGSSSGTGEGNGTKTCSISQLAYESTYTWFVNVSDGTEWSRKQYSFTVEDDPANEIPSITSPSVANGSIDVDLSVNFSVLISDDDNDLLNWSIQCSNGQNKSKIQDNPGVKYILLTSLSSNTTYIIWVNATDGINWTKEFFLFTTRPLYTPQMPTNCTITQVDRTNMTLTWNTDSMSDCTRVERNTVSTWPLGNGTLIYNSSETTVKDSHLSPGTTYYYQLWSWNKTDNLYSPTPASISSSTLANHLPIISDFSIINGSTNVSLTVNWSATITDTDGDLLDWSITSSNNQTTSGNTSSPVSAWLLLENLTYNTSYTIWVNVSDGFEMVSSWYTFTTTGFVDTAAPVISNVTVTYSSPKDILIGWENISGIITDASPLQTVTINISLPDGSFSNQSMIKIQGTNQYYVNTSFPQSGNYTFCLWAVDVYGYETFSSMNEMSLSPNWDVNEDGNCTVLDLTAISNAYGQTGSNGWIRADVDNNGEIQVLDFVLASNHYGEGWW